MDNSPYEAPKSDIKVDVKFERSIWWKIYFFIMTVLSAGGMISFLLAEGAGLVDYIETALFIIATAGFFGFVFLKKILFPKFWLPFLIVYIISGFGYEYLSDVNMREGMTDNEYYISMLVGIIISLPAYFAIFSYSRESNPPWNDDSK